MSISNLTWKRTLRTASSERFLALRDGRDAAAVDLHYLANGTVAGTVILLNDAGWTDDDVPALLRSLDEDFLPDVDLSQGLNKPVNIRFSLPRAAPIEPPSPTLSLL